MANATPTAPTTVNRCKRRGSASRRPRRPPPPRRRLTRSAPPIRWRGFSDRRCRPVPRKRRPALSRLSRSRLKTPPTPPIRSGAAAPDAAKPKLKRGPSGLPSGPRRRLRRAEAGGVRRRQGLQEAQAERNRTPDVHTERLVANEPKRAGEAVPPTPRAAPSGSSPASESVSLANGQKPAIKSVSFDLNSGIKTIRMMDGTVHEEPIDSSAMSKLGSEPAGASLTSFVDQVRKAPRPQ